MGRIGKFKSHELAKMLTENNREKLDLLEKITKEQLTKIADSSLSKELKRAFQVFGDYMKSNSCVAFADNTDSISFYLDKQYPSKDRFGSSVIRLDTKKFKEVKSLIEKLEKERNEYLELVDQLASAIHSLGTKRLIIESFPSLKSAMETEKPKLPANIESLKSRIIYG